MKKIFKKIKKWHCLLPCFFSGLLLISHTVTASSNNPFSVNSYGNFTHMSATKYAPGNVLLQPMQGQPHLYGLGALQSLQGEVIIVDGNVLISRGTDNNGQATQVTSQDSATILATAFVKNWIAVPVPSELEQLSFEKFVLSACSKLGIPANVPFPFMVRGEIKNLRWHVVNGLNLSARKGDSHAYKKTFEVDSTNGILIGFYSGKPLEGVISHPGKRFHVHFTNEKFTRIGHVDTYSVGANATLFLPKN